jgi:TPR repeat protein
MRLLKTYGPYAVFPVLLSILIISPVFAGQFEDAMDAMTRGDHAGAIQLLGPLAEQGHMDAQYYLGLIHDKGLGVPVDYDEAVKWYLKAAAQGAAYAQNNLGVMYAMGQGVPQDYQEAFKWYKKAAEQGDAIAQNNLGALYEEGHGVAQDYQEALVWYQKAARQGNCGCPVKPGVPL